ncbi:MAG: folate family ECF transporter S component [Lachnospiraceae bacterium]|nr:folate family ECF transporter S component [Lachnospiraceae bacterium]
MSENHTHNHSSVLSVQVLVFLGLMGALSIVLSFVGTIRIGNYLRIGFSDLPNRLNDFLLGPFLGALFGGVMDIVKYLLQPTGPFFPGYTLSAVCGSLIFGFITHGMHGHKLSLVRIFAAELLIKVFVNIGMNTAWSCLLYGNALMAILPTRILANLIQLPMDTAVIYFVLLSLEKSRVLSRMQLWLRPAARNA